jgi:hypothetical protein
MGIVRKVARIWSMETVRETARVLPVMVQSGGEAVRSAEGVDPGGQVEEKGNLPGIRQILPGTPAVTMPAQREIVLPEAIPRDVATGVPAHKLDDAAILIEY